MLCSLLRTCCIRGDLKLYGECTESDDVDRFEIIANFLQVVVFEKVDDAVVVLVETAPVADVELTLESVDLRFCRTMKFILLFFDVQFFDPLEAALYPCRCRNSSNYCQRLHSRFALVSRISDY